MKKAVIFVYCTILFEGGQFAMTERQLKAASKMVQRVCQPKTKATDADIDAMHRGDWNVDRTAMCYMQCGMQMYNLMTEDNSLDMEVGYRLVDTNIPVARRAATKKSLDRCKDSAKTLGDKCMAAYEITKCFYFSNPENYFLP